MDHQVYGDFDLGFHLEDLEEMQNDEFSLLEESLLSFMASDTLSEHQMQVMERELKQEETMSLVPEPASLDSSSLAKEENPDMKTRYRTVDENDLKKYEESHQSKKTRENTKWAVKVFQDWHTAAYGGPFNFESVTEETFSQVLRKFYCEVTPQISDVRTQKLGAYAKVYHKNSMKNIRSGLNRHLADLHSNIDIVHGSAFKTANRTLDGFMKEQTKAGISRPTEHKPVIETEDLEHISTYLAAASTCPIILRHCVWFNLAIHFVARGLEFHHQLRTSSFNFCTDTDGTEYVTLTHETQQKNFQGGLSKNEAPTDRRMYATNKPDCPVAMLQLLIRKSDPKADMLFNTCVKDALIKPAAHDVWYTTTPLSKRMYSTFMADICKSSKTAKRYTAHSLRATAIQAMSDQGFETRHIMYMSGHRNVGSIQSYSRAPSTIQKKQLSKTLSHLASNRLPLTHVSPPTSTATFSDDSFSIPASAKCEEKENIGTYSNPFQDMTGALFQSGSFNNCSFNIQFQKDNP